jgi:hypothetical protein
MFVNFRLNGFVECAGGRSRAKQVPANMNVGTINLVRVLLAVANCSLARQILRATGKNFF